MPIPDYETSCFRCCVYDVGMSVDQIYEIKKIDSDFFEEEIS